MANNLYRHDIDGLRALAVLSVVFYHAGIKLFSGGYVGVDIFFVISGYLITGIIYVELEKNTFSFKAFWMRRARRILPAAFVMMLTVFFVFAYIYPASLFIDVAQSIIAQLLFAANLLFTLESSYFNQISGIKPLLHTWSLAVEEQFYFVFPFVLFFLYKFQYRHIKPILLVLCLMSLFMSIWPEVFFYPFRKLVDPQRASFFLLPARAWELGVGALLALWMFDRQVVLSKLFAHVLGAFGLILVCSSIILFDNTTPFPSFFAIAPVAGSALLILSNANQQSQISSLFSKKIVTKIGLISYSLYLWHWPVFIFFDYFFFKYILITKVFAILTSFVIATLSYKMIENPIRRNLTVFTNKKAAYLLVSVCLVLFFGGALVLKNSGVAFQADFAQVIKLSNDYHRCFAGHIDRKQAEFCELNPESNSNYSFVVIGDSYAHALAPAIEQAARTAGKKALFSSVRNCLPLSGFMHNPKLSELCSDMFKSTLSAMEDHKIKNIILISKWNGYMEISAPKGGHIFSEMWKNTIDILYEKGINIFVVEQPPSPGFEPRARYYKTLPDIKLTDYQLNNTLHRRFISVADRVKFVNLEAALCSNKKTCPMIEGEDVFYSDFDHLSLVGALKTTVIFLQLINKM